MTDAMTKKHLPLSGGTRQSFSESIFEKKIPIYTIGKKCKIYASSEKKNCIFYSFVEFFLRKGLLVAPKLILFPTE